MRNAINFQRKFFILHVKADNEHHIGVPNHVPPGILSQFAQLDSVLLVLYFTRNDNFEITRLPSGALDVVFAFLITFYPLNSKECISKINQKSKHMSFQDRSDQSMIYEIILPYEVVDDKGNDLFKGAYILPSCPLRS